MPENKKKKILWVVYDFYQAGGQRYVYEICKALNKDKYQVDLLKVAEDGYDNSWEKEFYYQPTLDMGCNIYSLGELLKNNTLKKKPFVSKLKRYVNRKIKGISLGTNEDAGSHIVTISNFLEGYDFINFSGLNVYRTLCLGNDIEPVKGIIHILTAQFQDDRSLFEGYTKTFNYHFVSSIAEKNLKEELVGINKYRFTDFPLSFETIPFEVNESTGDEKPLRIAIFTRLSAMKPLDPFFYALKLLLEKGMKVELLVYGSGDPAALGIIRQLNYLYILDAVRFMGHTEDIPATLKQAGIDLIWFQSNNQLPAGYAALEIAMSAIPQVFWDFMSNGIDETLAAIYPCFTRISDFTEYTEKLLLAPEIRKQLGIKQRDFILEKHSVQNNIQLLEKLYDV